jgi:hypothetical protein
MCCTIAMPGQTCGKDVKTRPRRRVNGAYQLLRGARQVLFQPDFRLVENHDGAGGQGLDGRGRAGFRERRTDDDGSRPLLHHLPQEGHPVHARHLDIQQNHVRPVHFHALHRKQRVRYSGDDLDLRVGLQQVHHHLAHHGRVVHDHDFDAAHETFR